MRWHDWVPRAPENVAAFQLWRAGALDRRGHFRARLAAAPGCAEAWRGLGSVRWTAGAFEEARACYARAPALEPDSPMHWDNLGLALRDLGQRDAAIAAFAVATGLDPGYEPAWNEWANVLVELGRPAEALPLYDLAIAIEAGRAVLHHNRGVCLRCLGRKAEAGAPFRRGRSRSSRGYAQFDGGSVGFPRTSPPNEAGRSIGARPALS